MMKIGTRVHDYGRDTIEQLFARIAADGFDTLMLAFQKAIEGVQSYYDVTPALIDRTKKALTDNHLTLDVLGVYMELSMVDEEVRRRYVEEFKVGLRAVRDMGATYAATETTQMIKQPGVTREEAFRSLEKSLAEILPEAERLGVSVAVEPVFYHTLATPEMTRRLLDDMASPRLRVVFDPVNLFDVPDLERQEALWDRAFDSFGEEIAVVHMKGICVKDGKLEKADFAHSVINYESVFDRLRALPQDLPIIREETNPKTGAADARFLRALAEGK